MSQVSYPNIDFLIIGAAKSATTWLQNSAQQHESVFMPSPELHFFSREYHRGMGWYATQFPPSPGGLKLGEKSNSYLTEKMAAERIHAAFPDVRLVVQIRNPVARAYSDYCMLFRRGSVSGDIDGYLDPAKSAHLRFIDSGCYARHLARFLSLFSPDQLLVLLFEDMKHDPADSLARFSRHIGLGGELLPPISAKVKDRTASMVPAPLKKLIKPLRPVLDPMRRTAPMQALRRLVAKPVAYPRLTEETAHGLESYFTRDLAALEDIVGADLSGWMSDYSL